MTGKESCLGNNHEEEIIVNKRNKIQSKINLTEERLKRLDGYLLETYQSTMQELDAQSRLFAEIALEDEFRRIDS